MNSQTDELDLPEAASPDAQQQRNHLEELVQSGRIALRRGSPLTLTASAQSQSRELLREVSRCYVSRERVQLDVHGLPEELLSAVTTLLDAAARGESVCLVSTENHLSPKEAGEILDVSRQYMTRLLDEGVIASTRTGTHRRVALADVLVYKEKRSQERKQGLKKLVQMGKEMGGYAELKKKR